MLYAKIWGTHSFDLFCTSTALLRLAYFDIFPNLDFLLVEKHRSTYSFGRSKVWPKRSKESCDKKVEVKSVGRSTERVEDMKMVKVQKRYLMRTPKFVMQKNRLFYAKNKRNNRPNNCVRYFFRLLFTPKNRLFYAKK